MKKRAEDGFVTDTSGALRYPGRVTRGTASSELLFSEEEQTSSAQSSLICYFLFFVFNSFLFIGD